MPAARGNGMQLGHYLGISNYEFVIGPNMLVTPNGLTGHPEQTYCHPERTNLSSRAKRGIMVHAGGVVTAAYSPCSLGPRVSAFISS